MRTVATRFRWLLALALLAWSGMVFAQPLPAMQAAPAMTHAAPMLHAGQPMAAHRADSSRSVVAFLQKLPGVTPAEYRAIVTEAPTDDDMGSMDRGAMTGLRRPGIPARPRPFAPEGS